MTAERKSTAPFPQTNRPLQNRVDPFGDFHAGFPVVLREALRASQ